MIRWFSGIAKPLRTRRRTWIGLAATASAIAWFVMHETTEEKIERLGGRVGKNFYGPNWIFVQLAKLPGGMTIVDKLSSPVSVNLQGTAFCDEHVQSLIGWDRLEFLVLRRTRVTDAGLLSISEIRTLQGVVLTDNPITDAGLTHLAGNSELLTLSLSKTRITDDGLKHLSSLNKLQHVELADTAIAGQGLSYIGSLACLENLRLERSQVRDDSLRLLRGPRLFALCLNETQITDAGVENLIAAPALVNLELSDTRVTDAALASLARFPHLERVIVRGTLMTPEGVNRFRDQHPKIRIEGPE